MANAKKLSNLSQVRALKRSRREAREKEAAKFRAEARARRTANKAAEDRGEDVYKEKPKSIAALRKLDDDIVDPADEEFEEVIEAEADDEFASHALGEREPKLLLTTIIRPSGYVVRFMKELQVVLPECYYLPRKRDTSTEDVLKFAIERGYTDVIIIEISASKPVALIVTHIPEGPTYRFRLSGLLLAQDMVKEGDGRAVNTTTHKPEVITKNFSTALARRVERQLQTMFPIEPEFMGRRVIAFINQHDYIFFRHYRYIFKADGTRVGLAEIGPKFTLRLRSLQEGLLDPECGKYEYFWRANMQKDKYTHFL